ncbi:MAG: RNA polymerase subunit sigma-24 [Cytophagia bacterium]|nr:RNA polymerase subunit sigma-24 [Cytophagia bacterium]|tara:strand:- start:836 stop:1444 length:609 start_codon:yes stop_codon:yes gene_type:complete
MDYKKKFSKKALNDFKLIDLAITKNDQNAYSEIMKSYKNSIYFTILKMIKNRDDAEDLTIEAFSKAFKNLHKFKKEFTFSTWLFRIATNNTIDFIRKKKLATTSIHTSLKDEAGQNIELDIKDSNLNPNEITVKNEKKIIVRQLVNKLPEKYQNLVKLRYFEELSYKEIAHKTNSPLGTIKAQLFRARDLLFEIMKNKKSQI